MTKYMLLCADNDGYFEKPRIFDKYECARRAMIEDFMNKMEITDPIDLLSKLFEGDDCGIEHHTTKLDLWGRDKCSTLYSWKIFRENID